MATHYAWSDLHYGGETEMRKAASGRDYKVVLSRNVALRGTKVTQKQLGVNKDEWEYLIESGSVRPYPIPDGSDENVSPARAMTEALVNDRGEIDVNKLMEMGFTVPPAVPAEEEEESDVPVGA